MSKATAKNSNKRRSPARKDALLRRFEVTVGRDDLMGTLDASMDPRAFALVQMMADPAYRRHSFGKLCEKVGLRHRDILDLFRRAKLDQAMIRMMAHFPKVAEDLAIDAESRSQPCAECDGSGSVFDPQASIDRVCRGCAGSGSVRVVGDPHARELLFKALGLTGRLNKHLVVVRGDVVQE